MLQVHFFVPPSSVAKYQMSSMLPREREDTNTHIPSAHLFIRDSILQQSINLFIALHATLQFLFVRSAFSDARARVKLASNDAR